MIASSDSVSMYNEEEFKRLHCDSQLGPIQMRYRMTKRTSGDILTGDSVRLLKQENGEVNSSYTRCHCRVTKIVSLSFPGFRVLVVSAWVPTYVGIYTQCPIYTKLTLCVKSTFYLLHFSRLVYIRDRLDPATDAIAP